jgi:hypothetical protein
MSEVSEGIWFPIANNHHLHNPISDQPADIIQPAINPHESLPGRPGANRKPPIRFPVANDHQSRNPVTDQTPHDVQAHINLHETSSTNRRTSIQSDYWSQIGSQAKADLVDGYTQLVTDRVRDGWSCSLVTFLFSQLRGPRTAIISRMKDEVQRVYSTLLTRVHRKPRIASTDELPVLIGAVESTGLQAGQSIRTDGSLQRRAPCPRSDADAADLPSEGLSGRPFPGKTRTVCWVWQGRPPDRRPASR